MDDDCTGYTIDVTVGPASITVHGPFTLMAPDVLDTLLSRMTLRATTAARAYESHQAPTQ